MNRSITAGTPSPPMPQPDFKAHALSAGRRKIATPAPCRWWREKYHNRRAMRLRGILFSVTILIAAQFAAASDGKAPAVQKTIAVLDFELLDLTLTPGIAAERERTASIGPMLRQTLKTEYGFELVTIDSDTQNAADLGSGYIFEHHDVAAECQRFDTLLRQSFLSALDLDGEFRNRLPRFRVDHECLEVDKQETRLVYPPDDHPVARRFTP